MFCTLQKSAFGHERSYDVTAEPIVTQESKMSGINWVSRNTESELVEFYAAPAQRRRHKPGQCIRQPSHPPSLDLRLFGLNKVSHLPNVTAPWLRPCLYHIHKDKTISI